MKLLEKLMVRSKLKPCQLSMRETNLQVTSYKSKNILKEFGIEKKQNVRVAVDNAPNREA